MPGHARARAPAPGAAPRPHLGVRASQCRHPYTVTARTTRQSSRPTPHLSGHAPLSAPAGWPRPPSVGHAPHARAPIQPDRVAGRTSCYPSVEVDNSVSSWHYLTYPFTSRASKTPALLHPCSAARHCRLRDELTHPPIPDGIPLLPRIHTHALKLPASPHCPGTPSDFWHWGRGGCSATPSLPTIAGGFTNPTTTANRRVVSMLLTLSLFLAESGLPLAGIRRSRRRP